MTEENTSTKSAAHGLEETLKAAGIDTNRLSLSSRNGMTRISIPGDGGYKEALEKAGVIPTASDEDSVKVIQHRGQTHIYVAESALQIDISHLGREKSFSNGAHKLLGVDKLADAPDDAPKTRIQGDLPNNKTVAKTAPDSGMEASKALKKIPLVGKVLTLATLGLAAKTFSEGNALAEEMVTTGGLPQAFLEEYRDLTGETDIATNLDPTSFLLDALVSDRLESLFDKYGIDDEGIRAKLIGNFSSKSSGNGGRGSQKEEVEAIDAIAELVAIERDRADNVALWRSEIDEMRDALAHTPTRHERKHNPRRINNNLEKIATAENDFDDTAFLLGLPPQAALAVTNIKQELASTGIIAAPEELPQNAVTPLNGTNITPADKELAFG